jgi:SAM-dependent methyltransferase
MSSTDAKWDERFRRGEHGSVEIDPILALSKQYWPLLKTPPDSQSSALDVACGAGRHAVYLACEDFRVTAVDLSAEGLTQARQLAASRNASIETQQVDLEAEGVDLGESQYDLVAVCFFLYRPLFPVLRRAVRPGGLLVYKTYSVDQLKYPGRPRHRMHMLEHNELLREFAGFRALHYAEEWERKGTAALIAQKPENSTPSV